MRFVDFEEGSVLGFQKAPHGNNRRSRNYTAIRKKAAGNLGPLKCIRTSLALDLRSSRHLHRSQLVAARVEEVEAPAAGETEDRLADLLHRLAVTTSLEMEPQRGTYASTTH